jgi:hypothetical protein
MRRTLPRVMVPLATLLLALPLVASPASADTVLNVPGGTGAVFTLGNDDVQPCDTNPSDGSTVRLFYIVGGVQNTVTDGSSPGCVVTQNVGTVTLFRVCSTSCTGWVTPV